MKSKKRIIQKLGLCTLVLSIYPLFVLIYTWSNVCRSDLEGGRHGPLDAYRHSLASAVVSYTLDESAVTAVTVLMESGGKETNRMDRHNNRIGAEIGARAESFGSIERDIRRSILNGMINSNDPNRITWMPQDRWSNGNFW